MKRLQSEISSEKKACRELEKLKAKMKNELMSLKKDRDFFKKKTTEAERKVRQIENRIGNFKAANAHLSR